MAPWLEWRRRSQLNAGVSPSSWTDFARTALPAPARTYPASARFRTCLARPPDTDARYVETGPPTSAAASATLAHRWRSKSAPHTG